MRQREGFTLIELLIVIVIIGILAALAVPKFQKSRDQGYLKAMVADLRSLGVHQELFYILPSNNYHYAEDVSQLEGFHPSSGVQLDIEAGVGWWTAIATHDGLGTTRRCGIYHGEVESPPEFLRGPGVVGCEGE